MSIRLHPVYEILVWVHEILSGLTVDGVIHAIKNAPTTYYFWWHDLIKSAPQHILIETTLIVFIIWLMFIRRTVDPKKAAFNKLSDKEVDWLVDSWEPEPLVPEQAPNAEAMTSGMLVSYFKNDRIALRTTRLERVRQQTVF